MKPIVIKANGLYLTERGDLSGDISQAAHHWECQFEDVRGECFWSSLYVLSMEYV